MRWSEGHEGHARAVDAGIVCVLFTALLVDGVLCPEAKGISAPGVAAAALATVQLFWRRQYLGTGTIVERWTSPATGS